jgi:hypothetical protein
MSEKHVDFWNATAYAVNELYPLVPRSALDNAH